MLTSQAIASVRSKVTRLRDHSYTVSHLAFTHAVIREFHRHHNHPIAVDQSAEAYCDGESLSPEAYEELDDTGLAEHVPDLNAFCERTASWDWMYAQTPDFKHVIQFPGNVCMEMSIHRGRIHGFKLIPELHTDDAWASQVQDQLEHVMNQLLGQTYEEATVHAVFTRTQKKEDGDNVVDLFRRQLLQGML